ncbi:MAG: prepilin-type N-terminal cleavage/methylation domain-containing protein [Gammaproteobacteria bacterium]|nr:prepilin-type N-terminal cleavage/methylation domain-containing protein [Gammaproteobacteria bacterium]
MNRQSRINLRKNFNGPNGFSLVELMVVVAVLSVIALAVAPRFSSLSPQQLDYAAGEIAEAIRFTRSEAMRLAEPRGFALDTGEKRIRVFRPVSPAQPGEPVIFDVRDPVSKRLFDVDLDKLEYARVDSLTRSSSYRGTCIKPTDAYFDAAGVAWCAKPDNVLLENQQITLTLGSQVRVVRLDGITGRVSIQ